MDQDKLEALVATCIERMETEGPAAVSSVCEEHPEYAAAVRAELAMADALGLTGRLSDDASVPGEHVGGFRILERLGGGGMGVVYLAEQEGLGRRVALKVIRPELLHFDGARERFRRETRAIAGLGHPGIVPIHTVGEDDGLPWYAMELVEGVNLDDLVRALKDRPGPPDGEAVAACMRGLRGLEPVAGTGSGDSLLHVFRGRWDTVVTRMVLQVAEALSHAHGRGIIHRDVKPSNLILTPTGRVVLLDFGLARAAEATLMTVAGQQPGSLPYMSPEQVRGDGATVDVRSDVYALGVTYYELLTLRPPYAERSVAALRERIVAGRADLPRRLRPDLSWDAETVCVTAMDPEPARRYATAVDLARDLRHVLDRTPIQARRPGRWRRLVRAVQRHPARSASVALAVLAFVVAPLLLAVQEHRARLDLGDEQRRTEDERDRARAAARRAEASMQVMRRVLSNTDAWGWLGAAADRGRLDEEVASLLVQLGPVPAESARFLQEVADTYWKLGFREGAIEYLDRVIRSRRESAPDRELGELLVQRVTWGLQERLETDRARERLDEALRLLDGFAADALVRAEATYARALAARLEDRREEALDHLAEAALLLAGLPPADVSGRAMALENNVGMLYVQLGEPGIARGIFEDLLERRPDSLAVAEWKTQLAGIHRQEGRPERAAALLRESMEFLRRHLSEKHPRVGMVKGRLGSILFVGGDHDAAGPLLRDAVEILERSGTAPRLTGRFACNLSVLLHAGGRYEEAARYGRLAVRLRSDVEGRPTRLAAHCLLYVARSCHGLKRYEEALAAARQSLELHERYGPPEGVAYTRRDLGRILYDMQRWSGVVEAMEPALPWFRAARGAIARSSLLYMLERVGRSHLSLGAHGRAVRALKEALSVCPEAGKRTRLDMLVARGLLGADRPDRALKHAARAHEWLVAHEGADHADTRRAARLLEEIEAAR